MGAWRAQASLRRRRRSANPQPTPMRAKDDGSGTACTFVVAAPDTRAPYVTVLESAATLTSPLLIGVRVRKVAGLVSPENSSRSPDSASPDWLQW